MLDVFKQNAFGVISMTTAINKIKYAPSRIGAMGLYAPKPINTLTAMVEIQNGLLSLIPSAARGGQPNVAGRSKRTAKPITATHLPLADQILADDVQGVRQFGSDNQTQGVQQLVTQRLATQRQQHEVTEEYQRLCGIKGVVTDADGTSVLYDFFDFFGISQPTVDFLLDQAGTEIVTKCLEVIRGIETALGGTTYAGVHCFCGKDWFDAFTTHAKVKDAYARWQDGAFLRADNRKGFEFGGITFEEYRGKVGSVSFIGDADAHFFPTGVQGLFTMHYSPADYIETVNTLGKPVYAKQEPKPMGKGIDIETQANLIPLCARPETLFKATES